MLRMFWIPIVLFIAFVVLDETLVVISCSALAPSSATSSIVISAVVSPVRYILVDNQGVITEILSNTQDNVTPIVYKTKLGPAPIVLSRPINSQYIAIMSKINSSHFGIIYRHIYQVKNKFTNIAELVHLGSYSSTLARATLM